VKTVFKVLSILGWILWGGGLFVLLLGVMWASDGNSRMTVSVFLVIYLAIGGVIFLRRKKKLSGFVMDWTLAGLLYLPMFFGLLLDPKSELEERGIAAAMIMLFFFLFLLHWAIRDRKRKENEKRKQIEEGVIPICTAHLRHIAGLADISGIPVKLEVFSNRLVVDVAGQARVIPMEQVKEAQCYEDTVMRQYIEGGGVLQGAVNEALFGSTFAMINSMPRTSYRREIEKYNILIAYQRDEDEMNCFVLSSDIPLDKLETAIELYRLNYAVAETEKKIAQLAEQREHIKELIEL